MLQMPLRVSIAFFFFFFLPSALLLVVFVVPPVSFHRWIVRVNGNEKKLFPAGDNVVPLCRVGNCQGGAGVGHQTFLYSCAGPSTFFISATFRTAFRKSS